MSNATTHSDAALAVARETGWNLEEYANDREWVGIGLGPVGQHRDSGPLDRSNFHVVMADLTARFGDAVDTVSFGHWAVGWIEEIASASYDCRGPWPRSNQRKGRHAMKLYSDHLELDDLHACLPCGCELEALRIARPRVRTRGWTVRLTAVSGARWTNTGTHGAGYDKAATWDQYGEWMAGLFDIDPHARIAFYDGRADFHRQTRDQYVVAGRR